MSPGERRLAHRVALARLVPRLPVRLSVAAFVASLLAVSCRLATVAACTCAILGRGPAILGSGLALGAGDLRLVRLQRVADRGVKVSLSGRSVSRLCRTISGLSGAIGVVEVVLGAHGAAA